MSHAPGPQPPTMSSLPFDILESIFRHFDPLQRDSKSLYNCCLVRKGWVDVVMSRLYRDIGVYDMRDAGELAQSPALRRYYTRSLVLDELSWSQDYEKILDGCKGLTVLRVVVSFEVPFRFFLHPHLASLQILSLSSGFEESNSIPTAPDEPPFRNLKAVNVGFGLMSPESVKEVGSWLSPTRTPALTQFSVESISSVMDLDPFLSIASQLRSFSFPIWRRNHSYDLTPQNLRSLTSFLSQATSLQHLSITYDSFLRDHLIYEVVAIIPYLLSLVVTQLDIFEFYLPVTPLSKLRGLPATLETEISSSPACTNLKELRVCRRTMEQFRKLVGWEEFVAFCERKELPIVVRNDPLLSVLRGE